ncbi:MAG: NAD(P)H-dependent oxidoreductase subunit E [Chloroflexi bacterium]|nr:NAD(P)H-dependent oxidoreductase subunit E [Chloroflexota bacterium]
MTKAELESLVKREAGTGYAPRIFRDIQKVIEDTGGRSGALIRVLQQAQGLVGYLPPPVLMTISRDLNIPLSEVNGIVSFYSFFTTVPRGKYVVQVCLGTCCYVRGGQRILDVLKKEYGLEPGDTSPDGLLSVDTIRCLGACALAPVVTLDGQVHRRVKATGVKELVSHCK